MLFLRLREQSYSAEVAQPGSDGVSIRTQADQLQAYAKQPTATWEPEE